MTLYVDREPHRLTEGMTGFVPSNRPHGFRVDSDDPLRVLAPSSLRRNGGLLPRGRNSHRDANDSRIPRPNWADLERMAVASAKFDMQRLGPLPPSTSANPDRFSTS